MTRELAPLPRRGRTELVVELIRETAEPLSELQVAALGPLLERIGDSRLVLIGEATHGTSEFYRIRAEITKELIRRQKIRFVAIEADWPDAVRVDQYVRRLRAGRRSPLGSIPRFPTWMWRNREVLDFIEWLREYNTAIDDPRRRIGFYGLDLYSVFTSIPVLDYLDRVDPDAARTARLRYGCLTPWEGDPALYGKLAVGGRYRVCENEAVATMTDLLRQRLKYDPVRRCTLHGCCPKCALVANAERYYRVMYYGGRESWNLRDRHMFDTLGLLLGFYGEDSSAVVWEHNSHVGDAAHTQMGASGEINVGQLCRERFGKAAYIIGQGTDHGTVAAAHNWDESMEIMQVRPAHPDSYEHLFHRSGVEALCLNLREPRKSDVKFELTVPRLERAIGVIYRPETELASHYFHAELARQFDEFIWFDRTEAVHPITTSEAR